jgi:flavin-binding protein dodecin
MIIINYWFEEYHFQVHIFNLNSRIINLKQIKMSVLKVIEILGNSTVSFEDAVQNVINEAAKSVKNIKSVYIVDMQVTVNNNKIREYRVNTKVTFGIIDN